MENRHPVHLKAAQLFRRNNLSCARCSVRWPRPAEGSFGDCAVSQQVFAQRGGHVRQKIGSAPTLGSLAAPTLGSLAAPTLGPLAAPTLDSLAALAIGPPVGARFLPWVCACSRGRGGSAGAQGSAWAARGQRGCIAKASRGHRDGSAWASRGQRGGIAKAARGQRGGSAGPSRRQRGGSATAARGQRGGSAGAARGHRVGIAKAARGQRDGSV